MGEKKLKQKSLNYSHTNFEPKYQHNTKLKKYCEKQLGEKKKWVRHVKDRRESYKIE